MRLRSAVPIVFGFFPALFLTQSPETPRDVETIQPSNPAYHCAGSISAPLDLELVAADGSSGQVTAIEARVTPRADVQSIELSMVSDGALLLGSETANVPGPAAGQTSNLPIQIQHVSDRSSVTVTARARSADGTQVWERTESFYTIMKEGRKLSGMGSFLQLEIKDIEDEYHAGRLSEEEARAATKVLVTLPAESNQDPISVPVRTPEEQARVDALALRPADAGAPKLPSGAGTCITIMGNVQWRDENNNLHPAFGLNAQIWDDDTIIDEFVDVTSTDENGDYYIEVDGDDGILQGDRDIYVKIVSKNSAVRVKAQGLFADAYEWESGVYDEQPCGSMITENVTFTNADPNPSMSLCEAATWVAIYTKDRLNGGSFLSSIDFEWPGDTGSANYNGSRINMRPGDRWDWDVLHHEYGHYIMDEFNFENNPGGPHNIGDCIGDVHNDKSEGVRLAWGEGWPTYNGTLSQIWFNLASKNIPRVGDVIYADTGESNFSYSLETSDNNGVGEDNELAVQRILWDFWDTAADGLDNVSTSDQTLFNAINGADPTTYSGAWAAIRAGLSNAQLLGFGAVNSEHFVGPTLNAPAAGAIVSPSQNGTFTWDRRVGCPSSYLGDSFTLRFFNQATSAPVLTIPVGNTTSYNLTLANMQTLIASSHNIVWAVEGSHTGSPATGPYLGENRAIIVNRPPVADAGTDVTAECTSSTTTPVQLNGTGSTDPDGDALTYSWTPAALFNNPNSSTPTGNFPLGTTNVTLTVSDGLEQDTDQVLVTIEDTTPPDVTCPADITIECNDHCEGGGVPKNDAQLTDFFADFTAVDICDTTPTLSNDAPNCFPLGTTTVTFTACDDDNNCADCTADVTVVDTTPPEITVELNRDALWPPNHKMAGISATVVVTDLCDPNPTFVLTSITSNEPDNGLGDGDTANDIQEASPGTPDVDFLLRSERAGGGNGRKYTIIYTAMDQSGNTTPDTVCVTVPHDQSGHAMASSGFNAQGTGFLDGTALYRLVVLSRPGLDVNDINPRFALVGNTIDAIRPQSSRVVDLNGDRKSDLELLYSVSETQKLRSMSTKKDGMGLHFSTAYGSWLVKDIFNLGPPLILVDGSPADKNPTTPELGDTEGPDGGEGAEGLVVVTDSGRLQFTTAVAGPVQVEVFGVTGRKLRTLVNQDLSAGSHDLDWDGRDEAGRQLPSGVYFYRIQAPDRQEVIKIRMVR